MFFKDLAVCLIILIAAAFPFGKMGGVATESVYNIIISSVKGFKAYEYLHCAFGCAVALLLFVFVHITFFNNYKRHFKIVGTLLGTIASIVFGILFFIVANYVSKIYGLTSDTFTVMIVIFVVADVLLNFAGYFVYRRQMKPKEKTEEQETAKSRSSAKKLFLREDIEDFITSIFITLLAALSCFVGVPNNFNKYATYKDTGYSIVIQCELDERFTGIDGIDDSFRNNIINNFQEGSTHVLNYKGITYLYWQDKFVNAIEEKEKEIRELMPESSSESDWKKYAEKIKRLSEEVDSLKLEYNKFEQDFRYDNVKVTVVSVAERPKPSQYDKTARIVEMVYDTQYSVSGRTETKWNNKQNKRLFYGQGIELSQTEFTADTDFSTVKIGATINYYDGSIKKSYITPSNCQELNEASKGKHTIKWSDDWGSYEYTINII